jgi:translation initiation factor 3 subunit J
MLKINVNDIADAEDFTPVAPVVKAQPLKSNWDDEDVEEDDVKESWEEEEEVLKDLPCS